MKISEEEKEVESLRIDLNQTIKHRLIERYGPNIGKALTECIQECISEGKEIDKDELKNCIKACLKGKKMNPVITDSNLNKIIIILGHWITVG